MMRDYDSIGKEFISQIPLLYVCNNSQIYFLDYPIPDETAHEKRKHNDLVTLKLYFQIDQRYGVTTSFSV